MPANHLSKYIIVLSLLAAGILFLLLNEWWHWFIVSAIISLSIEYDEYLLRRRNSRYKSTIHTDENFTISDALSSSLSVIVTTAALGIVLWMIDFIISAIAALFH